MERGTADSSAVPDDTSSSHVVEVSLREVLCAGAVCWAAWRYFRYITCLRTYGRDMTAMAGKADLVIGRDDEIDRVIRILCRRTKNCAALVGAAGVGKTAIAEGLAQRIVAGKVPSKLAGARVIVLNLTAMVSGTTYVGMFEERMTDFLKKVAAARGKVTLFVDEMHMLLGAGAATGTHMDAANMLKPALARGHIRCLGATTDDECSKYIEKDPALERRFQIVHVEEPSTHSTISILHGLKPRYQTLPEQGLVPTATVGLLLDMPTAGSRPSAYRGRRAIPRYADGHRRLRPILHLQPPSAYISRRHSCGPGGRP
uniref:Heat shock protein 101 n=1 Tax=Aegilops tauschii TaxID=37682 RepID=M8C4R0_AEGTA